jgi:hypothetical protein
VSGGRRSLESQPVEEFELQEEENTPKDSRTGITRGKERRIFFETKSLAEVYAQQGHISTALEIYRRIQERDPSDGSVANRIKELKERLHSRRIAKPETET